MTSLRKHELRETRSSDMNTGVLRLYCIDYWQSPYGASVKFLAGSRMWVRHALEQCCAAHYMSGCLKGMQGLRDNSLFFRSCLSQNRIVPAEPEAEIVQCALLQMCIEAGSAGVRAAGGRGSRQSGGPRSSGALASRV